MNIGEFERSYFRRELWQYLYIHHFWAILFSKKTSMAEFHENYKFVRKLLRASQIEDRFHSLGALISLIEWCDDIIANNDVFALERGFTMCTNEMYDIERHLIGIFASEFDDIFNLINKVDEDAMAIYKLHLSHYFWTILFSREDLSFEMFCRRTKIVQDIWRRTYLSDEEIDVLIDHCSDIIESGIAADKKMSAFRGEEEFRRSRLAEYCD